MLPNWLSLSLLNMKFLGFSKVNTPCKVHKENINTRNIVLILILKILVFLRSSSLEAMEVIAKPPNIESGINI